MGLGSCLLTAVIQRIHSAQIADRIALLSHADLVPFYESAGFKNVGKSKATFGGGNWIDMASLQHHHGHFLTVTQVIETKHLNRNGKS